MMIMMTMMTGICHDDDGKNDVQVAHKSERNLSSSSRHAYTFHVIGQNHGNVDDDDENDDDGGGGNDDNHDNRVRRGTVELLLQIMILSNQVNFDLHYIPSRDGGQFLCIQELATGDNKCVFLQNGIYQK